MQLNNEIATTDNDVANGLNSYFSQIGKKLAMKFLNVCPSINTNPPIHENPFDFKSVNESEIELILKTINVHKTAGVDNINCEISQNPKSNFADYFN